MSAVPALNAALTTRLAGIENKRFLDDQWFDFDAQGHLMLVGRPLDFLSQVWECLVRLFTNKYTNLENEIVDITARVEEYLRDEQDLERLDAFLLRFTPAMNELYRCAGRMRLADRISQNAVEQMQNKARIGSQVLVARNPKHLSIDDRGVEHQHYNATGVIYLTNSLDYASVRFDISNPTGESWQRAEHFNRAPAPHYTTEYPVSSKFSDLSDVNQVSATVRYRLDVHTARRAMDIVIDEHGIPGTRARDEADETGVIVQNRTRVGIINRSPYRVHVEAGEFVPVMGLMTEEGYSIDEYAEPGSEDATITLPERDGNECFISFKLPPQSLALNLRDGRYSCRVDTQGLHVTARRHRVV